MQGDFEQILVEGRGPRGACLKEGFVGRKWEQIGLVQEQGAEGYFSIPDELLWENIARAQVVPVGAGLPLCSFCGLGLR